MHARLFLFALSVIVPNAAPAAQSWDGEPFGAAPQALLDAAQALPPTNKPVDVLLSETSLAFDAQHRRTYRFHAIFRIIDAGAVASWGQLEETFNPWFEDQPVLAARVITPDGHELKLDERTVLVTGRDDQAAEILSDTKVVRAALPGVSAGAVVETVITSTEHDPYFAQGVTGTIFGATSLRLGARKLRLTLSAPVALPLVWEAANTSAAPTLREEAGRREARWELADVPAMPEIEPAVDSRTFPFASVRYATGQSWQAVAKGYLEMIRPRLVVDKTLLPKEPLAAATPARVQQLVRHLRSQVRYTGLEFGESGLVPYTASEIWTRHYGDCKDMASLLVALLRATGVTANVALVSAAYADPSPKLPGLGVFNHAIVYIPGQKPLWVDPTAEWLPVGQLPPQAQGRLALVVDEKSTALIATPEDKPAQNRARSVRRLVFADSGPARITERREYTGQLAAMPRALQHHDEGRSQKENLEQFCSDLYGTKEFEGYTATDPQDLATAFSIAFTVPAAKRFTTEWTTFEVPIIRGLALGYIDDLLTESRPTSKGKDRDSDEDKARKAAMLLPYPLTAEMVFEVVPPPGFEVESLPPALEVALGPLRYRESTTKNKDGSITATTQLEVPTRHLSAADVMAFHKAFAELSAKDPQQLSFKLAAFRLLNERKASEALKAFRARIAADPQRGIHHARLATALLALGLGEVSRTEARRGVELEPESATAWQALAWVLQHDAFGRYRKKGFDWQGSIDAYKKANELDPESTGRRLDYAQLLMHNADGEKLGKGAKLTEAIAELTAIRDELHDEQAGEPLLEALFHVGRYAEAAKTAASLPSGEQRDALWIAATAMADGAPKALALAEQELVQEESRRKATVAAAFAAMGVRGYPQAEALLSAAMRGLPPNEGVRAFVDILKKVKPLPARREKPASPASLVRELMIAVTLGEDYRQHLSTLAPKEEFAADAGNFGVRLGFMQFDRTVMADIVAAIMEIEIEGDAKSGMRARIREPGGFAPTSKLTLFLTQEDGKTVVLVDDARPSILGREALRRAQGGDLAGARLWLRWAREVFGKAEMPSVQGFFDLYRKLSDSSPKSDVVLAAGLVAAFSDEKGETIPILTQALAGASDKLRGQLLFARAIALKAAGRNAEALADAEAYLKEDPENEPARYLQLVLLNELRQFDRRLAILKEQLEEAPSDPGARTAVMSAYGDLGRFDEAVKLGEQLLADNPSAMALNNTAWYAFLSGKASEREIKWSEKAVDLSRSENSAELNTLACIYAEANRPLEAMERVRQYLEQLPKEEPDEYTWFVIGRVAEQLGLNEAALAAYAKVNEPEANESRDHVRWMVQARRARIGKI